MSNGEDRIIEVLGEYFGKSAAHDVARWALTTPNRELVHIRVYSGKDPKANPYYAFNKRTRDCVQAALAILSPQEPAEPDARAAETAVKLWEVVCGGDSNQTDSEKIRELSGHANRLVREFAYFISHPVYWIQRVAGGHRSQLENDAEIDLSVLLLPDASREEFFARARECCGRCGVDWKEIQGGVLNNE